MIKYKIKSDRKLVLQKLFTEEELASGTAQEMKFSIRDFFSKCDQIGNYLWIWSHLLKKSLIENFIFCAVLLDVFNLIFLGNMRQSNYQNNGHS